MPRQARIDYPGCLHHVMLRGMERTAIFKDDEDRTEFLDRLETVCGKTGTACLAFALMPNHVHLLFITGTTPVSKTMQKLLTGYARYFNHCRRRSGRLYQNRFKSILCEKESYLLELVRYIHLNPVRGKVITGIQALDGYAWTSHSAYLGQIEREWVAREEMLSAFGSRRSRALQAYRGFILAGLSIKEPEDLEGGGLIRSLGGLWEVMKSRKRKARREAFDERILGSGEFVERVLKSCGEQASRTSGLERAGWDFKKVLARAAEAVNVTAENLYRKGRACRRTEGRALACKWLTVDLQRSQVSVARELGISHAAVSKLAAHGRKLEKKLKISLVDSP